MIQVSSSPLAFPGPSRGAGHRGDEERRIGGERQVVVVRRCAACDAALESARDRHSDAIG